MVAITGELPLVLLNHKVALLMVLLSLLLWMNHTIAICGELLLLLLLLILLMVVLLLMNQMVAISSVLLLVVVVVLLLLLLLNYVVAIVGALLLLLLLRLRRLLLLVLLLNHKVAIPGELFSKLCQAFQMEYISHIGNGQRGRIAIQNETCE
jgi:hypothetical protein